MINKIIIGLIILIVLIVFGARIYVRYIYVLPYTGHYEDGSVKYHGFYKGSTMVGDWEWYNFRGQLTRKYQLDNWGNLDGPVVLYYDGGEVRVKGQYCKGNACGYWTWYSKQGAIVNRRSW